MSSQYLELQVKEVVQETADAVTVYFYQPENQKINYKPGQFLTLIFDINGEEERRAYSLCTSPYLDVDLAVTIKRVDNGKVSNFVADHVKAGDKIKVMLPLGNFTTEFNQKNKRHIVLFGGGSGVTPLLSLAKTILFLEPKSDVSLIYCNRSENTIIFKSKLEALAAEYKGRFTLKHVFDVPPAGWKGASGFLNERMIKDLLKQLPKIRNEEFFICGPEGMMTVTVEALKRLGYSQKVIRKESFLSSSALQAANKSTDELAEEGIVAREVKVIYDGQDYVFVVPPDKSILETALDKGIDLPFSCQSGLCTACRGKCLSGKVKLDEAEGLSESELKQGYVLTCVGHPLTENVVIEIG